MTTIGLSYSLVKISTKCAPALVGSGPQIPLKPLQTFSMEMPWLVCRNAPKRDTRVRFWLGWSFSRAKNVI